MTVARVVTGRAGQVQMRMELTPRFGYGLDQPRLKRAGADLLAVCGPDTLRLSTPIELDVRDGPGEGAPPWPVSWKLRPARLRYSLAAFQVELVSLGIGHYDPSSWCGLSAVLDDLGAKRHDAGELLSLGPLRQKVEMDPVLYGLGFGNVDEHQPRASSVWLADKPERVARHLLFRARPPGDPGPELRHRRGVHAVKCHIQDRTTHRVLHLQGYRSSQSAWRTNRRIPGLTLPAHSPSPVQLGDDKIHQHALNDPRVISVASGHRADHDRTRQRTGTTRQRSVGARSALRPPSARGRRYYLPPGCPAGLDGVRSLA